MSGVETLRKKQNYWIEIMTLILYVSALILIMYYHEPWLDEAQAWLIARDATIMELLTSITHYEGHPAIWFLMLMPFAKLGVPFELGIKAVNFVLATTAMGILIFKAPFPRIIRCTIPFTYFFFYQYGVVSRNYSLMMLGFVLSALLFKDRNEKPFRFVAALSLICAASVYGIVISAGIAMVWMWDILDKSMSFKEITIFLKSRRFYALLILLIYNILLLISVYPQNDTYAMVDDVRNRSYFVSLFYMFFMASADAICSDIYSFRQTSLGMFPIYFASIMSCIINLTLFVVTKMFKKSALFIVPYFLFALFSGLVYIYPHHIGILAMFYVFLLWCCITERAESAVSIAKYRYVKYIGFTLLFCALVTSIYWSLAAARNEIALNYGTGREAAEFIQNNHLDQLNILVAWYQIPYPETGVKYSDYNHIEGVPILAYFDKNIYCNLNDQANNRCYLSHKVDPYGLLTNKLIENNYPEVLLSSANSKYTFGTELNMDDYSLVQSIHGNFIWKNITSENRQFIFIRKDLLKNYPNLSVFNLEDEMIFDGDSQL